MSCAGVKYNGVIYNNYQEFVKINSDPVVVANNNKVSSTQTNFTNDVMLDQEEVKSYFRSVFPGMSETEVNNRLKFFSELDKIKKIGGKEAYGLFKDGVTYLMKDSKDQVKLSLVKHEVFHAVFNGLLTTKERENLLRAAKRENPKLSLLDEEGIEEYLADRFMAFKANQKNFKTGEPIIKQIFQSILKFFGFINDNSSDIDNLFYKIENGSIGVNKIYNPDITVTRFMEINKEYHGRPDVYRTLFNEILDRIKSLENPTGPINEKIEYQKNGDRYVTPKNLTNIPLKKPQAIAAIKKELLSRVIELKSQTVLTEEEAGELFLKATLVDNPVNKDKAKVFDHLIKDIYPNLSWKVKNVNNVLTTDFEIEFKEYSDEELESMFNGEVNEFGDDAQPETFFGKGDVTTEAEEINPLKRASESVKDLISTIVYNNDGKKKRVDPGFVFITMMKAFSDVNLHLETNESDVAFKNRILTQLRTGILGMKATKSTNDPDLQAIYDEVKRMFDLAYAENPLYVNSPAFIWKGTNSNTGSYTFQITAKSDKNNPITVEIPLSIHKNNTTVLFAYLKDILDNAGLFSGQEFNTGDVVEDNNKKYSVIRDLYQKSEARNAIAEIYSVTGSLRKKEPFIGSKKELMKNSLGEYVKVGKRSKSRNVRVYSEYTDTAVYEQDKNKFIDSLEKNLKDKKDVLESFQNRIAKTRVVSEKTGKERTTNKVLDQPEKKQIIKDFFKNVLKENLDLKLFSDTQINPILGDISIILEEYKKDKDIASNNIASASKSLVGLLVTSKGLERSSSFTTADGKTKWFYTLSNSAFDFMNFLKNDKKTNETPTSLLSENSVLYYNPFLKNNEAEKRIKQTIHKLTDHESVLDTSKEDVAPTVYKKEDEKAFDVRNFFYQYLATIGSATTKQGLRYYQSFYTISDKSQMSNALVDLLDNKGVTNGIKQMILSEAHVKKITPTFGLSTSQFNKNLDTSSVEGLEDYIKSNPNLSKLTVSKAITEIASNENLLTEATKYIQENGLTKSAEKLVNNIINSKIDFDENSFVGLEIISELIKSGTIYTAKIPATIKDYNNLTEEQRAELVETLKPIALNFVSNYYINSHFLNQIAAGDQSQYKTPIEVIKRMAGPFAVGQKMFIFENKNKYYNAIVLEDLIEFVDDVFEETAEDGTRKLKSKYKDLPKFLQLEIQARLKDSKENYEVADGSGFAIRQRFNFLRDSFGRSANIGNVMKPVYNGKNNQGVTTYVKNSLVELSAELQKAFPELKTLAFQMTFDNLLPSLSPAEFTELKALYEEELQTEFKDNTGNVNHQKNSKFSNYIAKAEEAGFIHEAYFKSAVKSGQPEKLTSVSTLTAELGSMVIDPKSSLQLNNQDFRIQLNLRKTDVESKASNPTQLNYFPNSNGLNNEEQQKILRRLSERIDFGFNELLNKYGIKNQQTLNNISEEAVENIKKDIYKMVEGVSGSEVIADMLSEDKISINFSVISEKVAQLLLQKFSRETIQIKHPGKKLILQSVFGTRLNAVTNNLVFNRNVKRNLETSEPELITEYVTNQNGEKVLTYFCECYIPSYISKSLKIKDGDLLTTEHPAYNQLVGYRIPSTELHSAVPLRVIGTYPSSENDNVIIVPREIVLLHGSDFDIDTLYTLNAAISKKTITAPDGTVLAIEGVPIGKTSKFIINADEQVELTKNVNDKYEIESFYKNDKDFLDYIKDEITRVRSKAVSKENEIYLKDLLELYKKGNSNDILYTYIDMISSEKNIPYMMKPITQKPFDNPDNSGPESTLAYAKAKYALETNDKLSAEDKKLFTDYAEQYRKNEINTKDRSKILEGRKYLSNYHDQKKIFGDNFLAKDLTGISANFMKGIRYLFLGSKEADPILNEDLHFLFENKAYRSIQRLQAGSTNEFNTDIIDTIINAAIDHVKEQKLNLFDINTKNGTTFMTAIMMGMNITDAALMQIQPGVKEFTSGTNYFLKGPNQVKTHIKQALLKQFKEGTKQSEINKYFDILKDKNAIIARTSFVNLYYTEKTLSELIADNDIEALEFQYKFLHKYEKIHKVGKVIDDFAKSVGIIQDYGKDVTALKDRLDGFNDFMDLEKYKENGEIIDNPEYIFTNFSINNVKNVVNALEASTKITSLFETIFHKYNKKFIDFGTKIETSMKEGLAPTEDLNEDEVDEQKGSTEESDGILDDIEEENDQEATARRGFLDKNVFKSIKSTVEQLIQYISTGVKYTDSVGIERTMSVLKEKVTIYKDKAYSGFNSFEVQFLRTGYPTTLLTRTGEKVFVRPLDKIISDNSLLEEPNKFIHALSIKKSREDGANYISFMKGAVADPIDKVELKDHFLKLKMADNIYQTQNGKTVKFADIDINVKNIEEYFNDFQHLLIKYGLQKNGLRFSSQSYAPFISPKLYAQISPEIDEAVKSYIDNEGKLEEVSDHFKINYAVNNIKRSQNITNLLNSIEKPETDLWDNDYNRKYAKLNVDNGNYYNIKLPTLDQDLNKFPKFARLGETLYVRLEGSTSVSNTNIYYQKISNLDQKNIKYQVSDSTSYRINNFFNTKDLFIPLFKIETLGDATMDLSIKSTYNGANLIEEGKTIKLYNPNDFTRGTSVEYKVVSIDKGEEKTITSEFKGKDYERKESTYIVKLEIVNKPTETKEEVKEEVKDKTEDQIDNVIKDENENCSS